MFRFWLFSACIFALNAPAHAENHKPPRADYVACFIENRKLLYEDKDHQAALDRLDIEALVINATDMVHRKPDPDEVAMARAVLEKILANDEDGEIIPESVKIDKSYIDTPAARRKAQLTGTLTIKGGDHPGPHTFKVRFDFYSCRMKDILIGKGDLFSILAKLKSSDEMIELARTVATEIR